VTGFEVTGPMELLRQGLEVTDTPGFGAAQAGEGEGQHQAVLDRLLDDLGWCDRILMCVAASDAYVITPVERDYYAKLGARCFDVVVNKWRGSDAEQARFTSEYRHLFPGARFHFVNARHEAKGQACERSATPNSPEREGSSGDTADGYRIKTLVTSILEETRDPAGRARAFDGALADAWCDLAVHLRRYYRLSRVPWQSLDLARLRDEVQPESLFGRSLSHNGGGEVT
jgi:hypothetical protein